MDAPSIDIIKLLAVWYEMHVTFSTRSSCQLLGEFTGLILLKGHAPQVRLPGCDTAKDEGLAVGPNAFSVGVEFEVSEETESMFNPFKPNLNWLNLLFGLLIFCFFALSVLFIF